MNKTANPSRRLPAAAVLLLLTGGLLSGAAQAAALHGVQHGVPYLNGGIGKEQVQRIERREHGYNLRMVFSEGRKNDYATDVRLKITDPHGKRVFGLADAGPLTDVKLPAGTYHVSAHFGSMVRSDTVHLQDGRPVDLYLHFPHDAPAS